LPEGCELVVTVREVEPEEAVTVTDVAFVARQVNVTICPAVIAFVLAEKIIVGLPKGEGGTGAGDPPPQLIKTVARANGKNVRTCRARERVRIAASPSILPVLARVFDVAGTPMVAGRTHGEIGGNPLIRRDEAFHIRPHGSKGR
jgi:hypothetical protein